MTRFDVNIETRFMRCAQLIAAWLVTGVASSGSDCPDQKPYPSKFVHIWGQQKKMLVHRGGMVIDGGAAVVRIQY